MVEQRLIIEGVVHHIMVHPDAHLDERIEYKIEPIYMHGCYFIQIPNMVSDIPKIVKKDSDIKVVCFSRSGR